MISSFAVARLMPPAPTEAQMRKMGVDPEIIKDGDYFCRLGLPSTTICGVRQSFIPPSDVHESARRDFESGLEPR